MPVPIEVKNKRVIMVCVMSWAIGIVTGLMIYEESVASYIVYSLLSVVTAALLGYFLWDTVFFMKEDRKDESPV